MSKVVPVFKKGFKTDIGNYRPISILNAIPKLFEKLVTSYVYNFLQSHLFEAQHDFVPKKSACTNLLIMKKTIIDAMEDFAQVDVIYTDFSKAFDSVNHKILISKLEKIGFGGSLFN